MWIIILCCFVLGDLLSKISHGCVKHKLSLSLLEHLFLLICDALTLFLLLLADVSFVLGKLGLTALFAPTLSLTRSEVIRPSVSFVTLDFDLSLVKVIYDDFDASVMT